jgi:hypothetical protein
MTTSARIIWAAESSWRVDAGKAGIDSDLLQCKT